MFINKKIISMVFILAFLLSGCTSTYKEPASSELTIPVISTDTTEFEFILPYVKEDGFNPYVTSNNLVLQNSSLLFTKIVCINPEMDLDYTGCTSITNNDLTVVINVDTSVKYSDGSHITGEDVASSILAAKTVPYYADRFANVVSATNVNDVVTLELATPDSLFEYLLDIPIIKSSDILSLTPTANGRYTYSDNGLTKNPYYPNTLPFDNITLNEFSASVSLAKSLSVGDISLLTSESEEVSYGINVARQDYYHMNNLIFLGLNSFHYPEFIDNGSETYFLKNNTGRKIISNILDRQLMVEKAFYSQGTASTGIINPTYPDVFDKQFMNSNAQLGSTGADFESLGYEKQLDGYYYDKYGDRLSLSLLYYDANSYKRNVALVIQSQLAQEGIEIILDVEQDFEQYKEKIAIGQFDMYIGEIKLYNNMDMSVFFETTGSMRAFFDVSDELLAAYHASRQNFNNFSDFEKIFAEELPFLPLIWRSGSVSYTKEIPYLTSSISDIFYGLENIKFEIEE